MKSIEVDEELYRYIAGQTQHIGESASEILRRLLQLPPFSPTAEPSLDGGSEFPAELSVSGIEALLQSGDLDQEESAIARFMLILTALYQSKPVAFTQATDIKGRKRVYFARDPQELLANGTTTKPKAVPGTPYWVISNTNTNRKRNIIAQLMTAMEFQADLIEQVCAKV